MPDVKDHDDPQQISLIAGFMLDRIVEDPGGAALPFPDVLTYTEPAFTRNDQGQVAEQAEVGHADMGRDRRLGRQQREHGIGTAPFNPGLREAGQEFHRLRAMFDIRFNPAATFDQVNRGPIAVVVEFAPLGQRLAGTILDIGHKVGLGGVGDLIEFSRNRVGQRLKLIEPGKQAAIVEFDFAQAGIMEVGGFGVVSPGPTGDV